MSKYGSLQRVISSHVQKEQQNGGSGWGPFKFFAFIIIAIVIITIIANFFK